jgi:hypothetical protein
MIYQANQNTHHCITGASPPMQPNLHIIERERKMRKSQEEGDAINTMMWKRGKEKKTMSNSEEEEPRDSNGKS